MPFAMNAFAAPSHFLFAAMIQPTVIFSDPADRDFFAGRARRAESEFTVLTSFSGEAPLSAGRYRDAQQVYNIFAAKNITK